MTRPASRGPVDHHAGMAAAGRRPVAEARLIGIGRGRLEASCMVAWAR